jgi:SAM-dependent methyltransferase
MASERPFDPCVSPEVAAYVRGLSGDGPALSTWIHPADEMYRYELDAPRRTPDAAAIRYFATARAIFRSVSDLVAWRFGGFSGVRSFLDFASGFGRTTRFLARALDPERITVAEIDPLAVRFQTETFGVRGCVSGHEPDALALESPFDLVLAVSFFSHLPAGRFEAWLERLYGLVGEGGLLVFSTHGEELAPPSDPPGASGLAFRPESETDRLAGHEYGTSWVTPEFVRRAAEAASGSAGRLAAYRYGLCGHQDLYVLAKPPFPKEPARLAREPRGALELATIEKGAVAARGWASGDRDERPPDVKLYFGERLEAASPGHGPEGARRDWSFTFPITAVSPDCVVRIEAESSRGVPRLLVAETLRPHLPAPPK